MKSQPYAVLKSIKLQGTFQLPGNTVLLTKEEFDALEANEATKGHVGSMSSQAAREVLLSSKRTAIASANEALVAARQNKQLVEADKVAAIEALQVIDRRIEQADELVLRAEAGVREATEGLSTLEAEIDADIASLSASESFEEEEDEDTSGDIDVEVELEDTKSKPAKKPQPRRKRS